MGSGSSKRYRRAARKALAQQILVLEQRKVDAWRELPRWYRILFFLRRPPVPRSYPEVLRFVRRVERTMRRPPPLKKARGIAGWFRSFRKKEQ